MWKVVRDWEDEPKMDIEGSKKIMMDLFEMMFDKAREGFFVTLRIDPDGTAEFDVTPWEPYRPTCPYADGREQLLKGGTNVARNADL